MKVIGRASGFAIAMLTGCYTGVDARTGPGGAPAADGGHETGDGTGSGGSGEPEPDDEAETPAVVAMGTDSCPAPAARG
jgi:hypothetical protein